MEITAKFSFIDLVNNKEFIKVDVGIYKNSTHSLRYFKNQKTQEEDTKILKSLGHTPEYFGVTTDNVYYSVYKLK